MDIVYQTEIDGITYTVMIADTVYFGGCAWQITTSLGGKRLCPASMPPECAVREWADGKPPVPKRLAA